MEDRLRRNKSLLNYLCLLVASKKSKCSFPDIKSNIHISRAVASSPAGPAMAGPVLARTFENINDYRY